MRIGLVVYGSIDQVSGGYFYDRKLIEALRLRGDEVDVLSLPPCGYARALLQNLLAPRIPYAGYDLIIQDELVHPSRFIANLMYLLGRRRRGGPLLVCLVHHLRSSEDHPRFLMPVYRLVEGAFLAGADAFLFNSVATERAVRSLSPRRRPGLVAPPTGKFPPSRGASARSPARAAPADGGPTPILFVGNLIERKGLHVLLDALSVLEAEAGAPPWLLVVVGRRDGDGPYARRIDAAVGRFPPGRIVFEGPVDDGRLAELYRSSRILAVPSYHEGFGIVYLEAMGFGVVPIASSSGGAGDLVEHGENGFLVDPGDSGALAALLRGLMRDRALLERLSAAARKRAEGFPGWDATMDRVRSFLSEEARKPRPSRAR
jgi:glycosyltransferase involved in cell wall biosynthesis